MSILNNVRIHSGARQVVIHLEHDDSTQSWTLTVHDDGRGFDANQRNYGVGLNEVVISQLKPHQIEVTIESHPGMGTSVALHKVANRSVKRESQ